MSPYNLKIFSSSRFDLPNFTVLSIHMITFGQSHEWVRLSIIIIRVNWIVSTIVPLFCISLPHIVVLWEPRCSVSTVAPPSSSSPHQSWTLWSADQTRREYARSTAGNLYPVFFLQNKSSLTLAERGFRVSSQELVREGEEGVSDKQERPHHHQSLLLPSKQIHKAARHSLK